MTVKNGFRVWDDEYEREHFTPEEIAASKLRVAAAGKLIKTRQNKTEAREVRSPVYEAVFAGATV